MRHRPAAFVLCGVLCFLLTGVSSRAVEYACTLHTGGNVTIPLSVSYITLTPEVDVILDKGSDIIPFEITADWALKPVVGLSGIPTRIQFPSTYRDFDIDALWVWNYFFGIRAEYEVDTDYAYEYWYYFIGLDFPFQVSAGIRRKKEDTHEQYFGIATTLRNVSLFGSMGFSFEQ